MRDRARHLTTARRRPRWRPATGGRKDAIPRVARLRHARATGCGHGTGGRHLRCHGHGRVGPSPLAPAARCAGPAAARSRSCGDGPSGLDQSGAVSCPTVPLPVRAPSARFPRLPRGPGSDGPPRAPPELPAWPGGSGALSAQFPLRAAVSPHRPSEPRPDFFESCPSTWNPVTESNRRPSPYHRVPIDLLARHFSGRPGQTLYFSSVERGSGHFAPDAISQIPPNR